MDDFPSSSPSNILRLDDLRVRKRSIHMYVYIYIYMRIVKFICICLHHFISVSMEPCHCTCFCEVDLQSRVPSFYSQGSQSWYILIAIYIQLDSQPSNIADIANSKNWCFYWEQHLYTHLQGDLRLSILKYMVELWSNPLENTCLLQSPSLISGISPTPPWLCLKVNRPHVGWWKETFHDSNSWPRHQGEEITPAEAIAVPVKLLWKNCGPPWLQFCFTALNKENSHP